MSVHRSVGSQRFHHIHSEDLLYPEPGVCVWGGGGGGWWFNGHGSTLEAKTVKQGQHSSNVPFGIFFLLYPLPPTWE